MPPFEIKRLLAVEHIIAASQRGRHRHGGNVGAGFRLGQRERRDSGAGADPRQIMLLQLVRSGERDRGAAKALHGEREIGKSRVTRQGFPGDHQIKGLQRVVGAAITRRDAVPQPPRRAERTNPAHTSRVDVAMAPFAAVKVGRRRNGPLVELLGKGTMLGVEERQPQVRGPAHYFSSPRWRASRLSR